MVDKGKKAKGSRLMAAGGGLKGSAKSEGESGKVSNSDF